MRDPEKQKRTKRKYYLKNKAKCIERARLYDLDLKQKDPIEWSKRWKRYRMTDRQKVLNDPSKMEGRKRERKRCYSKNLEYNRQYSIERHRKHKLQVFEHYGMQCSCCGESVYEFLTIDHMNNDGAKHRKAIGEGGSAIYHWLVKNDFPEGFQILCYNCNCGKRINSGICPHQRK